MDYSKLSRKQLVAAAKTARPEQKPAIAAELRSRLGQKGPAPAKRKIDKPTVEESEAADVARIVNRAQSTPSTPEQRAREDRLRQEAVERAGRDAAARERPVPSSGDIHEAGEIWKRRNPDKKIAGHEREVLAIADDLWRAKRSKGQDTGNTPEQDASHKERMREAASGDRDRSLIKRTVEARDAQPASKADPNVLTNDSMISQSELVRRAQSAGPKDRERYQAELRKRINSPSYERRAREAREKAAGRIGHNVTQADADKAVAAQRGTIVQPGELTPERIAADKARMMRGAQPEASTRGADPEAVARNFADDHAGERFTIKYPDGSSVPGEHTPVGAWRSYVRMRHESGATVDVHPDNLTPAKPADEGSKADQLTALSKQIIKTPDGPEKERLRARRKALSAEIDAEQKANPPDVGRVGHSGPDAAEREKLAAGAARTRGSTEPDTAPIMERIAAKRAERDRLDERRNAGQAAAEARIAERPAAFGSVADMQRRLAEISREAATAKDSKTHKDKTAEAKALDAEILAKQRANSDAESDRADERIVRGMTTGQVQAAADSTRPDRQRLAKVAQAELARRRAEPLPDRSKVKLQANRYGDGQAIQTDRATMENLEAHGLVEMRRHGRSEVADDYPVLTQRGEHWFHNGPTAEADYEATLRNVRSMTTGVPDPDAETLSQKMYRENPPTRAAQPGGGVRLTQKERDAKAATLKEQQEAARRRDAEMPLAEYLKAAENGDLGNIPTRKRDGQVDRDEEAQYRENHAKLRREFGLPPDTAAPERPAPEPERPKPAGPSGQRVQFTHSGDGTTVRIDRDDLEARQALKSRGFKWSRNLGAWYLPRNWGEPQRRQRVDAIRSELGDDNVHVEDHGPGRTLSAAERDKQAREQAAARAERMGARAERASAEADRRFGTADAIGSGIPFGQPILVGHHSERRHRAALDKIHSNMDKGVEAHQESQRAEAARARAERAASGDVNPDALARRIDTNEAELRKIQRDLDGSGEWKYGNDKPATGAHRERLEARKAELVDRVQEDRKLRSAAMEKAGRQEVDVSKIKPGDIIWAGGRPEVVTKVNAKTVSVHTPRGFNQSKIAHHQIKRHQSVSAEQKREAAAKLYARADETDGGRGFNADELRGKADALLVMAEKESQAAGKAAKARDAKQRTANADVGRQALGTPAAKQATIPELERAIDRIDRQLSNRIAPVEGAHRERLTRMRAEAVALIEAKRAKKARSR